MNAAQRDQLLARLDERVLNIYHLTEKQERHLAELNESVKEHQKGIAVNKRSISLMWKLMSGGFILLCAAIPIILKLLNVY